MRRAAFEQAEEELPGSPQGQAKASLRCLAEDQRRVDAVGVHILAAIGVPDENREDLHIGDTCQRLASLPQAC